MAGFIQNIIWNSVEGFVEAGTRTAGEYAGNALIKAGDMIENGGRGVGNSKSLQTNPSITYLVLIIVRYRAQSNQLWLHHIRSNLPAFTKSSSLDSTQTSRQTIQLDARIQ